MFNNTWSSNSSSRPSDYPQVQSGDLFSTIFSWEITEAMGAIASLRQLWVIFGAASFLVSVPVFIQAPLVRLLPELSLAMTVGWFWLSRALRRRPSTEVWGDLLLGFAWSWLAGSIYWGWLRWEPQIHLPVEAIGLPFALWCLWEGKRQSPLPLEGTKTESDNSFLDFLLPRGLVGNLFYLGSLFGTAVTDIYFYLAGLIPHWRELMQVDPALANPIFQSAIAQVKTPWGAAWGIILASVLLVVGLLSLRSRQRHWWAFGGAVLSTILVDSLFWLAASTA